MHISSIDYIIGTFSGRLYFGMHIKRYIFVHNCYTECVRVQLTKFFDDKVKVVRRMLFPRAFVFLKPSMNACPVKMQLIYCKRVISCVKPNQLRFYHRSNISFKGAGKRSPNRDDYVFPMRDEHFRKGVKWATYGSFALGLTIISVIVYKKVIQTVYRRGKGFIDIQDRNCSKSNMILYKNTVLPNFVEEKVKSISDFEVQENDVWVVGYPRSGTV